MAEILTVADLERAKQDDTFHAEVITGKLGGNGANIDFATHARTGQIQMTLPAMIRKYGFGNSGLVFGGGGFLNSPSLLVKYNTDNSLYRYIGTGTFPIAIPAAPDSNWQEFLATVADAISNANGGSVQDFIDSFALKIFQSPTYGGLTEIQTLTVNAGEVYEVRKTSNDSLATIYSNATGTTEIVQNGTDNVSDSAGVVKFYIADGYYYVEVGGVKSNFEAALATRVMQVETIADLRNLEYTFDGQNVILSDGGRSGLFKFVSHDVSALVTMDQLSGVSVAPNLDTSGASGAWLRQFGQSVSYDGRISVKWFGAVGDFNTSTGTGTDSTAAIQAAAEFVKQSGSIRYPGKPGNHPFKWKQCVLDFETGFYLVTSPLWFGVDTMTETDYGKVVKDFRGDNAVVIGKTAGKPIVDMTGAFGVRGEGVTFMGWNVDSPNVGFLMARSGNSVPHNPSAGNHYFRDINFAGWFTVGPVYNYGSEINHWVHCDFAAETGKCAFYHTADNFRLKLTSDNTTVDTTVQSCYGDLIENCTFNVKTTTTGDEGLFIVESTSYGPSVLNSYLDSDSAPHFLVRRSTQLTGTAGIVQTLRIRDNTFEAANQSIVKLVDSATLTSLSVSGNAMPILGSLVPHIHVTSGCTLSDTDAQPFSGDTTNLPTRVQNDGNIARQHTTFFPLADVYLSDWYRTEGQLTKDSTWRELNLSSDLSVPVTAKWVDVRVNVRTSTLTSDGIWLSLRGNAFTPIARQFTAINEVINVPQYFEGKVPVVDGKIEYYCHPNLSRARIMVLGYQI